MGHDNLALLPRDDGRDRQAHEGGSLGRPIVTIYPCLIREKGSTYIASGSLRMLVPDSTKFDEISRYVEYRSPLTHREPPPPHRIPTPGEVKADEPEIRLVKGSKGDMYEVVKFMGKVTCTCAGFKYRADCKHLRVW